MEARKKDKKPQDEYRRTPRIAGETPRAWMARVHAAREYVNRVPRTEQQAKELELSAFLALFHPEVPADKRQKMVKEAYRD